MNEYSIELWKEGSKGKNGRLATINRQEHLESKRTWSCFPLHLLRKLKNPHRLGQCQYSTNRFVLLLWLNEDNVTTYASYVIIVHIILVTFKMLKSPIALFVSVLKFFVRLTDCGGAFQLFNQGVTISQPNFPSSYPVNTKCDWHFSVPVIQPAYLKLTKKVGLIKCYVNKLQLDAEANCKDQFLRLQGRFKEEAVEKTMCKKSDWGSIMPATNIRLQLVTDSKSETAAGVNFSCVGKR